MSSLLYILRGPIHATASSLYSSSDAGVVTLGIEDAVTTIIPLQPIEVLQSEPTSLLKRGERLTYQQFLDVVLGKEKIIIL